MWRTLDGLVNEWLEFVGIFHLFIILFNIGVVLLDEQFFLFFCFIKEVKLFNYDVFFFFIYKLKFGKEKYRERIEGDVGMGSTCKIQPFNKRSLFLPHGVSLFYVLFNKLIKNKII